VVDVRRHARVEQGQVGVDDVVDVQEI
jgi:hypothetical protein